MAKGKYEIMKLLEDGISQEVSASDFEVVDLANMVESAVHGNTTLFIRDSEDLDDIAMGIIAGNGKRSVVFR